MTDPVTPPDHRSNGEDETAERSRPAEPTPTRDEPTATVPSPPEPPAATKNDGFESRAPQALGLDLTVGGLVLFTIALVLLIVSTLLVLFVPLSPLVYLPALAVPSILAFPLLVLPRMRHRRYRYRADERGLEVRQGVWWRSQRFIPRSRLQHSDIAQGPLERRLGLASLIVHTAGTHEAQTRVEGLALETARAVRDRLTAPSDGETDGV